MPRVDPQRIGRDGLTFEQMLEIRQLRAAGWDIWAIADEYDRSESTVKSIVQDVVPGAPLGTYKSDDEEV